MKPVCVVVPPWDPLYREVAWLYYILGPYYISDLVIAIQVDMDTSFTLAANTYIGATTLPFFCFDGLPPSFPLTSCNLLSNSAFFLAASAAGFLDF